LKSKIIWMLVSCLIVLSLVIASCGPKEKEEAKITEEGGQVVTTKGEVEEAEGEEEEIVTNKDIPQYGGTLTLTQSSNVTGWDEAFTMIEKAVYPINEPLITDDWTKGPVGSHDVDWVQSNNNRFSLLTGSLAENWEMPDDTTILFHIRPGVHWQNIPPVNGREFTAQDAAWNLQRYFTTPTSYQYKNWPESQRPTAFNVLDKYTLEVKVPADVQGPMLLTCGLMTELYPPDMVAQYGDMKDWKHACGTGPFILTDYIPSSTITYARNTNYWQTDPIGPGKGNQLPYYDIYKVLIIPDNSTVLAAFRSGKLDILNPSIVFGTSLEDFQSLKKTNPEIKYLKKLLAGYILWGRVDKPELPFKDIRVRQALNLAINRQEIVDQYYGGESIVSVNLFLPIKDFEPFNTPLDEMPTQPTIEGSACSVEEVFSYNPTKAKQLLVDAGYPDGFKTSVICQPTDVDFLSIIREYFLKIGVDMEIEPLEAGTYMSVYVGHQNKEMIAPTPQVLTNLGSFRKEAMDDQSGWENPRVREVYNLMNLCLGKDEPRWIKAVKDIAPFILEQCIGVWLPPRPGYTVWQPWVKNYHGETITGQGTEPLFLQYLWIDTNLKKSMGY
jgi:peptide/nickel transport system substrate-binding protein